ncbi:NAD(P)H-dependent amine dehydrogenase family protein [Aeromicrobium choanae]|uniref:Dihydrodipicolinate reductase N-terminal domain-containing protein n=1 Tax=Aeromicrobium choanae TaxID=1736691 RepID=A0A1T4YU96_9ACTN|nr:hypothetical protein [Aeromicrobium choanae]SKB05332.1 hypothetical protein SAMN06295964_0899 [Aeromicrobium choanae]
MTHRVVQWATGAMGTAILRTMLDHPGIEVVGTYVYGERKAGRDVGDLARRDATGVLATSDVDEILALDADVVVHAGRIGPYGAHDDEIVALLESGKNVLSINGYTDPFVHPGERLDRLRAAAERGGVTLMGVGLNPGFIGEQVAVLATGVCASVDHIEVVEMADARLVQDPDYLFGSLGFGAPLDAHDPNDPSWGPVGALNGMYEEVLGAMAHHLGMTVDEVVSDHVCHPAGSDLEVSAGVIREGTVGHTNWRWHAMVGGRRRLTMSIHWFVETAHLPEPEPPLWRVNITGHPGVRIAMELEKHPDDRSRMGAEQYAVAGQVINAVPHVVAAPPGLAIRPVATPARDDFVSFTPR